MATNEEVPAEEATKDVGTVATIVSTILQKQSKLKFMSQWNPTRTERNIRFPDLNVVNLPHRTYLKLLKYPQGENCKFLMMRRSQLRQVRRMKNTAENKKLKRLARIKSLQSREMARKRRITLKMKS